MAVRQTELVRLTMATFILLMNLQFPGGSAGRAGLKTPSAQNLLCSWLPRPGFWVSCWMPGPTKLLCVRSFCVLTLEGTAIRRLRSTGNQGPNPRHPKLLSCYISYREDLERGQIGTRGFFTTCSLWVLKCQCP